jgi:Domain of unknown function (DUF3427)
VSVGVESTLLVAVSGIFERGCGLDHASQAMDDHVRDRPGSQHVLLAVVLQWGHLGAIAAPGPFLHRGAGFTALRRELGWLPPHHAAAPHPQEERLSRAIASGLLHLDDPDRLRATAASLAASAPPDPQALSEREMRQWLMLTAQLFGTGRQWRPLDQALAVLWQAGAWREELIQLLELLAERADRRLHPLPWALPVPLRVHGHYTRAEIEAAFGILTTESPWIHREGVLAHQPSATDLLFITLRKSEALFSPSTRYRDLALGPALFHWESQSTTTASSPTGQRYIHHASRGSRVLLFVREQISVAAGAGDPGGVAPGDGVGGLRGGRAAGQWDGA